MPGEQDAFLLTMVSDTHPARYTAGDAILAYLQGMDGTSVGALRRATGRPREVVRYYLRRLRESGAVEEEGLLRKRYSITFFGRPVAPDLNIGAGL